MKKAIILLSGLFLMATTASAQGIDDRAVIPVAVTLNSILRLNVVSGGNVEFNFNTLNDYQNGIGTSAAYQTKFNVASSVNWDVNMYAEDATLTGTDIVSGANTMPLNNIGYHITSEGTGTFLITATDAAIKDLTNTATEELVGWDGSVSNAGDIAANSFTIHWRCGTREGSMNGQTILEQPLAADRYATNVFLVLQPTDN